MQSYASVAPIIGVVSVLLNKLKLLLHKRSFNFESANFLKKDNMKKYHALYLGLAFSMGIAGCSNKLECNSSEAKETAFEITKSGLLDRMGDLKDYPEIAKARNEAQFTKIKTVEADKELGKYTCQATYSFDFRGETISREVDYFIEYLEDKKKSEVTVSKHSISMLDSLYWPSLQKVKEQGNNKVFDLMKKYKAERSRPFTFEEGTCVDANIKEFNKQNGLYQWEYDDLVKWDEKCIKEVAKLSANKVAPVNSSTANNTGSSKSAATIEACVDAKINEFRKSQGQDAPINNDVLEEWTDACSK